MTKTTHDAVNHPSHYTQYPVEVIELTRHMSFDRGNAVKYIARAGFKGGPEKELEDIKKAIWYLNDDRKELEKKLGIIASGIGASDIQQGSIVTAQKEASNATGGSWHISSTLAEDEVAASIQADLAYKLARG